MPLFIGVLHCQAFGNLYVHLLLSLIISLAPGSLALKTILKKFYQSLNPLRKSNDPLNYLESFPPVCDASNKSLNINFFQAFLLPINQSSIHLVTSILNCTIFINIHNTENLEI